MSSKKRSLSFIACVFGMAVASSLFISAQAAEIKIDITGVNAAIVGEVIFDDNTGVISFDSLIHNGYGTPYYINGSADKLSVSYYNSNIGRIFQISDAYYPLEDNAFYYNPFINDNYTQQPVSIVSGVQYAFQSIGEGGTNYSGPGFFTETITQNSVPEPSSIALLAAGILGFAASRKKATQA